MKLSEKLRISNNAHQVVKCAFSWLQESRETPYKDNWTNYTISYQLSISRLLDAEQFEAAEIKSNELMNDLRKWIVKYNKWIYEGDF